MCSTPAPPSTAFVAARIGSGVGEVNTAPGTAASSMPGPTKPPCSGSCPLPPPLTRPTFPGTGASLRQMKFGSCDTRTRVAWAAPKPERASLTTSRGSLMSFFMIVLRSTWPFHRPTYAPGAAVPGEPNPPAAGPFRSGTTQDIVVANHSPRRDCCGVCRLNRRVNVDNIGVVFLSEVVGTALLVLLGCGATANVSLARSKGAGGGFLIVSLGWGLVLFAGVTVAYNSGAHLNPAVTLGLVAVSYTH